MARTRPTGTQAPEAEVLPAITPAESFDAWWAATIPNSPVSRNTPAYNKLHELRSQFRDVLSSVTGE